jgi:GNAT superfamily N-acetyltransferase
MTREPRRTGSVRDPAGVRIMPAAPATRADFTGNVTLRQANAADAVAVADVYLESRKWLLPFAPLVHHDHSIRRWINEHLIPSGNVRVAVHDDAVIAMCATSHDGISKWIDQLYVAPTAVGVGVGTLLLVDAIAKLRRPIRLYTFQQNLRARRFYEHHGFVPISFGDGTGNEEGIPDVLYERDLPDWA